MPSRRAEIAMTPEEQAQFLRDGHTLMLVTIGPDGVPDPVPMWYVVDGAGTILMRTFTKSQKIVNLKRDPRYAALVEAGERYAELRGVQLTGTAELFEDPDLILDTLMGLATKYEDAAFEHIPALREAARPAVAKMTGIRLVPDKVATWDHRKLGGGF